MAPPRRVELADPTAVDRAVAALQAGGTVLLPTDTVYGIAALPTVEGAINGLFALKGRAAANPVAVLVADVDQARWLTASDTELDDRLTQWWPGALTVVVRRSSAAAGLALGGDPGTIGIRCPDHDLIRAVARRVGPIATTSANRSGEPTAADVDAAVGSLSGPVDLVIDGGPAGTVASTVVDATIDPWRVLRQGAVRLDEVG